jgi:hypothetical protein
VRYSCLLLSAVTALSGCGADESVSGNDGSPGAPCGVSNVADIAVAAIDLEGYPPYAIDGCKLAYVSAATGALVVRDLASNDELEVAAASELPRRPTLAGDVLAWQAGEGSASAVFVSFTGSVRRVAGAFDHAGEPRAAEDAVVFTGWHGPSDDSDTDVFLVPAEAGPAELALGGVGQQRFADVSRSHVAVSDFSEDPTGTYRGDGTALADLVVIDRVANETRRVSAAGKQAFPMLGSSGRIVYLEWHGVHPVPKMQEYTLRFAELATLEAEAVTIGRVTSDRPTVRPVTRNALVEWVERPVGSGSLLHRVELGAGRAPVTVSGLEGLELFAPAASGAITVIAVRPLAGGAPTLRAFER